MSPACVAGGIVFARVRFLATKRYFRGFALRRERQIVKNSFLDRLGAIFVPIAAISLRGVAKKGCCSKKVNAPEHVLEHMLTCDSEYRRTESLDILMFMLI